MVGFGFNWLGMSKQYLATKIPSSQYVIDAGQILVPKSRKYEPQRLVHNLTKISNFGIVVNNLENQLRKSIL